MTNLPEDLVRFYEDGPTWPQTPEQQDAERAYRDAFLLSAREAAHWTSIDKGAIDRAWEERRGVRSLAEVLIPSSKYFGIPELDSQQVVYKREHVVDASRTRGRVHGFEFVRQCWHALLDGGVDERCIAKEIIKPWIESVSEWVATEIAPDRLDTPRQPDEDLSERQRRMLEQAKHIIATTDPTKPYAILKRLNEITREQLQWLWPGRIPLGKLTLLAGDPGLGKSFVTLDLTARVSRGDCWPDMPLFQQTPGNVILLNCEDDAADTIAPRLDKAGVDDTRTSSPPRLVVPRARGDRATYRIHAAMGCRHASLPSSFPKTPGELHMNVTTFFEKMIGLQQQRSQQKQNSYRELVAGIATGEEPSAAEVERLLTETNKSITDLKNDVEDYQRRFVLKAVVASLPRLEQEFVQVQQQIAAADRVLEEAERRHDEITGPLYGRLHEIKEARNDASAARQELYMGCDDPELERQLDEANAEIERLMEANKELATQAVYIDNQADAEKRRAERELTEADRDHRREQAAVFQKQANSIRQRIKASEKTQADAVKRRDEIEERMRQW